MPVFDFGSKIVAFMSSLEIGMRGAAAVTYQVGRERVVIGDSNPQRQGNGLSTVGHAAVKLVKVKLVKQQADT